MSARTAGTVLCLIMIAALPTVVADDSKTRTWMDATGVFSVEAELVEFANGKVRLKRKDGKILTVDYDRLSSADQQFLRSRDKKSEGDGPRTALVSQLSGKPQELTRDDGTPAGKKSFPRGIASSFEAPAKGYYITSVRIHGGRYGQSQPPKEDFHISLCDKDFKLIADFEIPYSKFARGNPKWVALRIKPTEVPPEFVVCLNFNPTSTKGVFVSHDQEGKSLVGLPGKRAGSFTGGDWMIRVSVDQRKAEN
ncbi:MAG: SHD1 domain-containing protein [Pirellulaceae bacterium]|nr:hypothetical protein [Planctomycetaceae bacterium]MDP6556368.1 SHD1 domain-containing protein [Pirellulaceae bacterium]